jgi:biotin-(acetyl-CoA carboxylase) ligase
LEAILREALQRIKQYYQQVRLSGAETLNDNYLGHLYQRNQWHEYETDAETFEGRITGVAPYGFLQIEDRQGNVHTFDVKQVRYL